MWMREGKEQSASGARTATNRERAKQAREGTDRTEKEQAVDQTQQMQLKV
jgi:hypothetical protein